MRSLYQVYVLFAIYCLYTIPTSSGYPLPYTAYSDNLPSSERLALCYSQQTSHTNQPEEHIQDVYKRFLFHYAKNKDTRVPQGSGSLSVHPLMHMARKLTGRRKKRFYDASS
ncbi:neuromedin-S [Acipenser oxyrinchus oxyrinchus]|uniref:Neuromedin-S n=1 Tax=Acipenser oxyrinchus oxyrinchus TaxID=40147 RepID=A0AAD8G8H4_ACIOX|nr:neuromedin-S [Acipenser oxyrinchus oxyrinchus]